MIESIIRLDNSLKNYSRLTEWIADGCPEGYYTSLTIPMSSEYKLKDGRKFDLRIPVAGGRGSIYSLALAGTHIIIAEGIYSGTYSINGDKSGERIIISDYDSMLYLYECPPEKLNG